MGFGGAGNLGVRTFKEPWAVRKAAVPDLCCVCSWSQDCVDNMPVVAWLFTC